MRFFSAIYQDIEVQIGQKHLRLLKGESILIGAEQMHSYRMTEVGKCCLCPNIVFADEVLAPMTSTVFKKIFCACTQQPGFALSYSFFNGRMAETVIESFV